MPLPLHLSACRHKRSCPRYRDPTVVPTGIRLHSYTAFARTVAPREMCVCYPCIALGAIHIPVPNGVNNVLCCFDVPCQV